MLFLCFYKRLQSLCNPAYNASLIVLTVFLEISRLDSHTLMNSSKSLDLSHYQIIY